LAVRRLGRGCPRGEDAMKRFDEAVARLPVVLVVDPMTVSRFTMWRLLSQSLGVLEAPTARRASEWLDCRPDIGALVVQTMLPDGDGEGLARNLSPAMASRVIMISRPVDFQAVAKTLSGWFFHQDTRSGSVLMRAAERLLS
jgi:response regulator RpfG family c-di-GMP phosphodiesterase